MCLRLKRKGLVIFLVLLIKFCEFTQAKSGGFVVKIMYFMSTYMHFTNLESVVLSSKLIYNIM